MSEIIKIRGRLGAIRLGSGATRHALPTLVPERPGSSPAGTSPGCPAPPLQPAPDLETLLEEAYERGRADGCTEAEAALQTRLEEERSAGARSVGSFLGSMQQQLDGVVQRLEGEAFRFALAAAGRIVKREVVLDDEVAMRQIQEALRRVAGVESVKLRIHPRDEAMVRQERSSLLGSSESVRELVIEIDEKIEPGGCILETASGTVDARLYTQLEQIEAALFGQVVS